MAPVDEFLSSAIRTVTGSAACLLLPTPSPQGLSLQHKSLSQIRPPRFLTGIRTRRGMGHRVAPSDIDEEFVETWRQDRPAAPPLPQFAVQALRASLMNRKSPLSNGTARHFSTAEMNFFTSGEELASESATEEEPKPGWWRRFARAGSSSE